MSDIRQQIVSYANSIGLPSWIPLSIVGVEDPTLDPGAIGPQTQYGRPVGIFQILPGHFPGAEKATTAQLQNPAYNIQLGETQMKAEYVRAEAQMGVEGQSWTPYQTLDFVAGYGGWPTQAGPQAIPTDYRTALHGAYDALNRQGQGATTVTGQPAAGGQGGIASTVQDNVSGWMSGVEEAVANLLKWITPHAILIGGAALALILFLLHLGRDVPAVPA